MIDKVLGAGAGFDLFSPLARIVGDAMNGPSYTFLIPRDSSPLSGREIAWLLGRRGVKTWGLMVVSGTLMVSVRLRQVGWAQHLLEQAGVPIDNPVQARSVCWSSRQPDRRRATRQKMGPETLLDSVNEVLDTRVF